MGSTSVIHSPHLIPSHWRCSESRQFLGVGGRCAARVVWWLEWGEDLCLPSLIAKPLPSTKCFPLPIIKDGDSRGCRAARLSTLPSANRSSEDAVPRILTHQPVLLLHSLGEGTGCAEHSPEEAGMPWGGLGTRWPQRGSGSACTQPRCQARTGSRN